MLVVVFFCTKTYTLYNKGAIVLKMTIEDLYNDRVKLGVKFDSHFHFA